MGCHLSFVCIKPTVRVNVLEWWDMEIMLCLFNLCNKFLSALFTSHGWSVQLCHTHGQTECPDIWGGCTSNRLQIYEGGKAVPGAPPGQEKGGVWVVPTAQDLLCHDPEAQVHGIVQVLKKLLTCPITTTTQLVISGKNLQTGDKLKENTESFTPTVRVSVMLWRTYHSPPRVFSFIGVTWQWPAKNYYLS